MRMRLWWQTLPRMLLSKSKQSSLSKTKMSLWMVLHRLKRKKARILSETMAKQVKSSSQLVKKKEPMRGLLVNLSKRNSQLIPLTYQ